MSACISTHGEYGEHELDDRFRCTLCHEVDVERLLAALRQSEERADEAEARAGYVEHDYDARGEKLWRLATLAGHEHWEAENDACAELAVAQALARGKAAESALAAVRERIEGWLTSAPSATRDNGLMLPGDRETWRVREIPESALRAALATPTTPETTTTPGEAMTTTFADRRTSDHDCTTDTHCCSDCQTHDGCSCKRPTTPEETQP